MSKIMDYILRNQEEGKEFKQLISQEQALPEDYQACIDEHNELKTSEEWYSAQDEEFKDKEEPKF